jgi:hypothetical protein
MSTAAPLLSRLSLPACRIAVTARVLEARASCPSVSKCEMLLAPLLMAAAASMNAAMLM